VELGIENDGYRVKALDVDTLRVDRHEGGKKSDDLDLDDLMPD
jgi:hypothetical protein